MGNANEGSAEMQVFQRLQAEDGEARARTFELGRLRREASVSRAAGDYGNAVVLLRRALVLEPRAPASHLDLGVALLEGGQAAEAIERLNTAAALNAPLDVHRQLAKAYAALRPDRREREGAGHLRATAPRVNQQDGQGSVRRGVLIALCLAAMVRVASGQRGTNTAPSPDAPPQFTNVAAEAGIGFRHVNGGTPDRHLLEIMGSGGLFFDYDGDGWVDLFLVDGGSLVDPKVDATARDRLYKNRGDGTFQDVSASSGITHAAYGMGACAADYDNDGWTDLYVTSVGPNRLYHNDGGKAIQRRHGASRRCGSAGLQHELRIRRHRSRQRRRSLRRQLRRRADRQQRLLWRCGEENPHLLPPAQLPAAAGRALSQQWQRHIYRRLKRGGHHAARQWPRRRQRRL